MIYCWFQPEMWSTKELKLQGTPNVISLPCSHCLQLILAPVFGPLNQGCIVEQNRNSLSCLYNSNFLLLQDQTLIIEHCEYGLLLSGIDEWMKAWIGIIPTCFFSVNQARTTVYQEWKNFSKLHAFWMTRPWRITHGLLCSYKEIV